jgi:hypothetical protein
VGPPPAPKKRPQQPLQRPLVVPKLQGRQRKTPVNNTNPPIYLGTVQAIRQETNEAHTYTSSNFEYLKEKLVTTVRNLSTNHFSPQNEQNRLVKIELSIQLADF